MPLQIFVSHSARKEIGDPDDMVTTDHLAFLQNLCRRLAEYEENGENPFSVIVDYDMEVGRSWRKLLLDGVGACSAGIILLNKKAITVSDWVITEANVMRWRDWNEDSFLLVLVALGEGSRAAFEVEGKWEPMAFREVQFLDGGREFSGPAMSDEAFTKLVTSLPRRHEESPFEKMQKRLRKKVHDALDEERKDDAEREANGLLAKGPDGLHDLVERQRGYLTSDWQAWIDLVDEVACWWVEPQAALPLANGHPETSRQSFSLNCSKVNFTPRQYVRHACCRERAWAWKVVDGITANSGQQDEAQFLSAVVDEVRTKLKRVYRLSWPELCHEEIADVHIRELIFDNAAARESIFVVLPHNVAGNVTVKSAILNTFPGVKFLHTATDERAARAFEDCLLLEPPLDPDDEHRAHKAYTVARGLVNPDNA